MLFQTKHWHIPSRQHVCNNMSAYCRATVTAVYPARVSDWGGIVTVSGSGFGNERQSVKVMLRRPDYPYPHDCVMLPHLNFSSTSLQCVAPPASWTSGSANDIQLGVVIVVSHADGEVNSECTGSAGCASRNRKLAGLATFCWLARK